MFGLFFERRINDGGNGLAARTKAQRERRAAAKRS
jgi:hypothetical protein